MKKSLILSFLLCLLACVGCVRRPFVENRTEINLSLKIQMSVEHEMNIPEPELVRVCLCDPETGKIEYEDYLGPHGGYIYPKPGIYDIMVYNINTESTIVKNENNLFTAEATTGEISKFLKSQLKRFLTARQVAKRKAELKDTTGTDSDTKVPLEKIVNEPDHVFVGKKDNIEIPTLQAGESRDLVIQMDATSIVEVWKVRMTDVKGTEYISQVSALMTGMVESKMMYSGKISDNAVTIYFEMKVGEDKKSLEATFRTFGKNPLFENLLELDLNVTDTGGEEHYHHFDVTDQFDENKDHLIIVDEPVEIEKPQTGGGGFAPEVDDWEDVNTDIII